MQTVNVISRDILIKVLKKLLTGKDIEPQYIEELADYVLTFFGFGDSIIDNILTPPDRDIFYMLEELGILRTDMEEIILVKGKNWRIHYWEYRKDKIIDYLTPEKKKATPSLSELYDKFFATHGDI
jgi:hypothetical protein